MKFIDLVKKRKSTRSYSSRPVSRELIDQCLAVARLAPSACNSQPWSFIVVDDEQTKNRIVKEALSGIYRSNHFVKEAPVIIVVLTENSTYIARMGGMLRGVQYNLIDIGIACDHFTLQAEELGLGTCWLGWFNEDAVKKTLGLSKKTRIDVMISLGYPGAETGKTKIRKPLNKVHRYYKDGSL
ncbi:MAG: nitroreductase family protein [Candidatus Aminicenantes bacterium]|nr:nitroreductase family protein [Candidatus Aminicenantes bacterium]